MCPYIKSTYGQFSVENLTRREPPPKSEWHTFSVSPLTDEESRNLQRGIHGDGTKKFFKDL